MEDYSQYNPRLDIIRSDKHAIRLAVNEFLLNGRVTTVSLGEMELTIQNRYMEPLGKLLIPFGSGYDEIYQSTKSFLINNLNNELPGYCKFGHELCNSLVNIKDDIFFTKWEHIVWLETPFVQGFRLNDSISIYLLVYNVDKSIIRLIKAITGEKRKLVKEYDFIEEYNLFNDPNILVRRMIFDIYEGGFEEC